MSEKPQTSNQTSTKKILLSFEYRDTRMGGFDDTILISFRSGKLITSRLHTSRSGHHGTRQYALLPAKYLMYTVHRSNLGNTYISVKIIEVNENGETKILQEWQLYEGKRQKMQLTQLPRNIAEILMANKDELPLFYYVDQQPE